MKRSLMAMVPLAALALGAVALEGTGTSALAHPPMPGPGPEGFGHGGPGGPGFGMPMLEGLDLTKKQKDAVHQVFRQSHDGMKDLHKQEKALHDQVVALLLTPGKIDSAQLQSLTQQQAALEAKKEAGRMDVAVKIHDILTADQLTKAKERHDKISALLDQLHEIEHPQGKDED